MYGRRYRYPISFVRRHLYRTSLSIDFRYLSAWLARTPTYLRKTSPRSTPKQSRALKRYLIDRIIQDRNEFARSVVQDLEQLKMAAASSYNFWPTDNRDQPQCIVLEQSAASPVRELGTDITGVCDAKPNSPRRWRPGCVSWPFRVRHESRRTLPKRRGDWCRIGRAHGCRAERASAWNRCVGWRPGRRWHRCHDNPSGAATLNSARPS